MKTQDDDSAVVNRFAMVAERFCSLVDSSVTLDRTEFLVQVYRRLPELITEAMRLPRVTFDDDDDEDREGSRYWFHPEAQVRHEE